MTVLRILFPAAVCAATVVCLAACGGPGAKAAKDAETLMEHGELNKALEAVNAGLKTDPKNKALHRQAILILLKAGKHDRAFEQYNKFNKEVFKNEPVFVNALGNKDAAIRAAAAHALAYAKDPRSLGALQKAAADPNDDARAAAVGAIGQLRDPKAAPVLAESLKDKNWLVRGEAAAGLGRIGDPNAVTLLFGALSDKDDYVRNAASTALVDLVGTNNAALYEKQLEGGAPAAQATAALALARIGNLKGAPILLRDMKDASLDFAHRTKCVERLARSRDKALLPEFQALLGDKDPAIRIVAAAALPVIPDPSSVPLLKKIAADSASPARLRETAQAAASLIERALAASAKP